VWFLANTLLLDEDVDVQQTARQAVVAMCGPPAPEEFIDEVVLPRVRELVEDAQEEDNRMEGFLVPLAARCDVPNEECVCVFCSC